MSIFDNLATRVKFGDVSIDDNVPRIGNSAPRVSGGGTLFKGPNVAGNALNIWKNVKKVSDDPPRMFYDG